MNFGNPAFLYALPVVLVPVIIHFLKLYRTTTFYYSRVEDIKRLKKDQKKVKQLRDWLTLLLRTLAILFLIIAFAQPSFNSTTTNNSGKQASLHFIVDNSPSNDLGGNQGLNAYKTAIINALDNLPEDQSISLYTANETWENELIGDAIKKVNELTISNEAFSKAIIGDSLSKKFIFSDFQSAEWSKIEGNNIQYLSFDYTESNIAIDTAYIVYNQNTNNEVNLVVNYSRSANSAEKTSFELLVNGENNVNKTLDFGNDFSLSDTIQLPADSAQFSSLTLSIDDPNGLLFDNSYYLSLAPRKRKSVLVYGPHDANTVFEKLLAKDADYDYKYLKQGRDNFSGKNYSNILVVSGINNMDANLKAELERLMNAGGSCLFFPGNEVDKSVNDFLSNFQVVLSKQETEENQLQAFNFNHPYFKDVFDQVPNDPSLPRVSNAYSIKGASTYTELIKGLYGSMAVQLQKRDFQLVLTGIPFGEDKKRNTFFQHALFVPFSHKALEQNRLDNNNIALFGNRLFNPKQQTGQARILTNDQVIAELPWQRQFGKSFLNLEGISLRPGFYTLETDGSQEIIAINAPRSESNLNYLSESDLSAAGLEKMSSSDDGMAYALLDFENNDGYLFFAFVFICLLLESLINKFLSHENKAVQRG